MQATPSPGRSGRYPATPWSEQRLYRPFIRAALIVALTLGFTTGAAVLITPALGRDAGDWALHVQGHGLAQVFGFAGLFVMGIASHVVPRFRHNAPIAFPWPQRASLALVLTGLVLRWPGQAWAETGAGAVLLVASGVMLLAGVVVFTITIGRVLQGGSPSPVPVERWLWAGFGWATAAAAIHLWVAADMAAAGASAASYAPNQALLFASLFGFIGNVFFGVSLRAVAGFMGLRRHHRALGVAAFGTYNAGVAWTVLAWAVAGEASAAAGGMLLLAAGAAAFILALRVFEPRAQAAERTPGSYPRYDWFLTAAYAWLLVGMGLFAIDALRELAGRDPLVLYYRAPLHIVTLGTITMAIFGFAARVLPLFEAVHLRRVRWMDAAFVLLNASVISRIVFSQPDAPAVVEGLAISGASGLGALLCFTVAIWPVVGWRRAQQEQPVAWLRPAVAPPSAQARRQI